MKVVSQHVALSNKKLCALFLRFAMFVMLAVCLEGSKQRPVKRCTTQFPSFLELFSITWFGKRCGLGWERVLHTRHTRNSSKASMLSGASGWGIWTGRAGCNVRKSSEKAEGIAAGAHEQILAMPAPTRLA